MPLTITPNTIAASVIADLEAAGDFKAVYRELKDMLRAFRLRGVAERLNARLKPGATMEERLAERSVRLKAVAAAYPLPELPGLPITLSRYSVYTPFGDGWLLGEGDVVSWLLTAHRAIRGKVANHGYAIGSHAQIAEAVVKVARARIVARKAAAAAVSSTVQARIED